MRKIYMVDLGLIFAAGTIAAVLTADPVPSQSGDVKVNAAATDVSAAKAITLAAQELWAEWVSYEEDDPGSE